MSELLFLAELTVMDPNLGPGARVLRYANFAFTTGPAETPASTHYQQRLLQPALMARSIFKQGATVGRAQLGYGDLKLANMDGALDGLLEYGFDGQPITIRMGVPGAAYPAGFTTMLVATMEQVEVSLDTVTVRIRDRMLEFNVPLQVTKFSGLNALPDGLEGTADIGGKPKPICYGAPLNVTPPCVNTSKLIYQVNDVASGALDGGTTAVYDQGAALTVGATYASLADLLDDGLAPAAGAFKAYPAGGYFRLGSSPAGLITADVYETGVAGSKTPANVFERILTRWGAVGADYVAADITALDALTSSYRIGYWSADETTFAEVLDQVAGSAGAWWGMDRLGQVRVKQFGLPTGTAVATFTPNDIVGGLARVVANEPGRGVPSYEAVLRWKKNYTVQRSDLAGSVTAERRAVLAEDWQTTRSSFVGGLPLHLLSPSLTFDSLMVEGTIAALTERLRLLGLRGARRDILEFSVALTATTALVDLGDVIELVYPRYGIQAVGGEEGKLFRVIGLEPDAGQRTVRLTVWGPRLGGDNRVTQDAEYRVTSDGDYRITQTE